MFDKKAYMRAYKRKPIVVTCANCNLAFQAIKRSRKYCQECIPKIRSAQAQARWDAGHGTGFRQGHPAYLKHHTIASRELMSRVWTERIRLYGQHPNSIKTQFKKGHASLSFKGMHTAKGLKTLRRIHMGKRNPMYGKPITRQQKKLLEAGWLRKAAVYGFVGKSRKDVGLISWIDYQLNSEENKGLPKRLQNEFTGSAVDTGRCIGIITHKGKRIKIFL